MRKNSASLKSFRRALRMAAGVGLGLLVPASGMAQLGTPFTVIDASSTSNTATSSWTTLGNFYRTTGATAAAVARVTSVIAGRVEGITLDSGGAGYSTPPTVTFSGGGGSGAAATAVLSTDGYGTVVAINITNKGSGYANTPTSNTTNITLSAPPAPVVGGVGSAVHFYTDIGTTNTINLDGARTVGQMIMGDLGPSNSYVLAAGTNGTLTFNNGAKNTGSFLNKFLGVTDTISAPVILQDQLHVRITTSRLNITGNITGNGNTLTSYGNGMLSLTGNNSGSNFDLALWNRGTTNTAAQVELGATTGNAVGGNIIVGNASRGTSGHAVLQLLQGRSNKDQISDTATVMFDSYSGSGRNNYFKLLGGDETVGRILDLGSLAVIENREGESVGTSARLTIAGNADSFVSGFIRDNSGANTAQSDASGSVGGNSLALTKQGAGNLTLTGGNIIFTGGLNVEAGKVVLKQATNFRSDVALSAGTTLVFDNTGTWNFTKTFADPDGTGSQRAPIPQDLTVTGAGNVEKTGNGILRLGGTTSENQNIGGTLTVRNGTLNLMGDGATGATVGGGLIVTGDSGLNRNVNLLGRTTINGGIDATGRFSVSGSVLRVTGTIINNGDQETSSVVNGVATINGAINVTSMDLRLESGINVAKTSSGSVSGGSTVRVTNSSGLVVGMRVSSSAAGVNIPAGTVIQAIDPVTRVITLNNGVTVPNNVALSFDYANNGDGIINGAVTGINIAGKPSQIGIVPANPGGLYLVNSRYSNSSSRLPTSTPINMRGGVVELVNDGASGVNFSQQLGALNLMQGQAQVANFQAALNNTSVLQFGSLNRSAGATVEFVGKDSGTDHWSVTNTLGTNTRNQIKFTTAPTLDDGIIGGWAWANNEFVKYGANGVTRLLDSDYLLTPDVASNGTQTQWAYDKNVKLVLTTAATTLTLTNRRAINSLNIQPDLSVGASNRAITLNSGVILSIESGGILANHGSHTITGNGATGYVTVGTPSNTPAELVVITGTTKSSTGASALTLNTAVRDFTMDVSATMQANSFDLTVPANTTSMVMVGMKVTHPNLPAGTVITAVVRTGNTTTVTLSNKPTSAFTNSSVNFSGGSVGLTKTGPGTLVLTNSLVNTYTGPTVINNGILRLRSQSNLGTAPAVASPDHLRINGGTLQFGQDALGGVQPARAPDTVYTISDGTRGVSFGQAGGRLEVGHATPLPDTRTSGATVPIVNVTIGNRIEADGLVELAVRYNANVFNPTTNLREANSLTLGDENSTNQFRGGIKTEGGTAFGGGIITINGENYINGLFMEGGLVTLNHKNNLNGAIRILSGELTLNEENTYNNGSLFPDPIVIGAGTVNLKHEKALGTAFKVEMADGARLNLFGTNQTILSLTGTAAADISNGYAPSNGQPATKNSTLTLDLAVNETFAGRLRDGEGAAGSLSVIKRGEGRLALTNEQSDFSGNLRIERGMIDVTTLNFTGGRSSLGIGALGDPSEIVIGSNAGLSFSPKGQQFTDRSFTMGAGPNGATLVANGLNQAARVILGANLVLAPGTFFETPIVTKPIAFEGSGARTLTLSGVNAGDNEFQIQLSDKSSAEPTSLYKMGPGTWLLGTANDYSGQTTVQEGVLAVTANNVLGTTGTLTTVSLHPANTFVGDLPNGLEVLFMSLYDTVMPNGILPNVRYYVVQSTGSTFKVSTTKGGDPIQLTAKIKKDPFDPQGPGTVLPPVNIRYVPLVQTVASTQGFPRQGTPGQPGHVFGYFTGTLPRGTVVTFSLGLPTRNQGLTTTTPATFPGGITAYEPFYVVESVNDTFRVSRTPGGTAVDMSTGSTGSMYYTASVPGGNTSQGVNVIGGRLELRNVDYATQETVTFQGGALSVPARTQARWAGNMDIQANTTFTVGGGSELVLDGALLGNRAITQLGEGTIRLSGETVTTVLPGSINSESDNSRRNWTLQAGTLILDYTKNNNSKLVDSATFVMGGSRRGGVLRLQGSDSVAGHEEVVGALSLQAGSNQIYRDSGSSTIRLNNVTRAEGASLYFDLARIASVDNLNINNILGGWAIIRDAVVQANWVITGTVSRTFTADVNSDFLFTGAQNHLLANGTPVRLTTTGTLPAPLMAGTTYFVVNASTRSFKLSTEAFGTPIDLTSAGSPVNTVATYQPVRSGAATLVFTANADNYPGDSGNDIFRVEIVNSGLPGSITSQLTIPPQLTAATPLIYKIITTADESSATLIEDFVTNLDPAIAPYLSVKSSGVDLVPDAGHYGPVVLSDGDNDNGSQEMGWARNGTNSADGLVQVNTSYSTNTWSRNINVNLTSTPVDPLTGNRTAYTLRFATNTPVNVTLEKNPDVPNLFTIQTGAILVSPTVGANDSIISGNGDLTTENDGNLRNFLIHQYNEQGDLVIGANMVNRKPVERRGRLTSGNRRILSGLSTTADLQVGATVTGSGIPGSTTITKIYEDGHTLAINNEATAGDARNELTFTVNGNVIRRFATQQTTTTQNRINGVFDPVTGRVWTGDIYLGMPVSGPGIPVGATVDAIFNDSDIRINTNHFFNAGNLDGGFDSALTFQSTVGLEKMGGGTLILSGINTYAGPTFIANGVLRAQNLMDAGVAGSLGISNNNVENLVFNGGTLQLVGENSATNRNFRISDSATINVGHEATNSVFSGSISTSGTIGAIDRFAKTGSGTLELRRDANINEIQVSEGKLRLQAVDRNPAPNGFDPNNFGGNPLTSLRMNGGSLEVRGTAEGNFTQSFGGVMYVEEGASEIRAVAVAGYDPNNLTLGRVPRTTVVNLMGGEETSSVVRSAGGTLRFVEQPDLNSQAANIFMALPVAERAQILPWAVYQDTTNEATPGVNNFAQVLLSTNPNTNQGAVVSADASGLYDIGSKFLDANTWGIAQANTNASEGGFLQSVIPSGVTLTQGSKEMLVSSDQAVAFGALQVGMSILGPNVPAGTVIEALFTSPYRVTMSQEATADSTVGEYLFQIDRTFYGTITGDDRNLNTLRYYSPTDSVVTIAEGRTLTINAGAILVAANVRGGHKQILGGGNITGFAANSQGGDFIIHNYNTGAPFTIGANVVDSVLRLEVVFPGGSEGLGSVVQGSNIMNVSESAFDLIGRIAPGMEITGPGVTDGTTVVSVIEDRYQVVMSKPATETSSFPYPVFTFRAPTSFVQSGIGTTVLAGNNAYTGQTFVHGGVLRLDSANAVPGGITSAAQAANSSHIVVKDGVIGLGQGDFSRSLGTGDNQIEFKGSGGFAAYGADRVVDFGGLGATKRLRFGNDGFVADGSSLILGAHDATHKVSIINPIDLGSFSQAVRVVNGPAEVEGELSGVLSGLGRLIKFGQGTLRLSGQNAHTGGVEVADGRLVLANVPNVLGTGAGGLLLGTSNTNTSKNAAIDLKVEGGTLAKDIKVGDVNSRGADWVEKGTVDISPANLGTHSSMAIVNDNPAIAYYDASTQDLKYVRAADSRGTSWLPPVTLASRGDVGQYPSLAVINGNPAVSYYDATNGTLCFIRSTDASGVFWSVPLIADANPVNAVARQADGKVIVGGTFLEFDGASVTRIARLSSTGVVEPGFNTAVNGEVRAIVVQSDGKIIVGGAFTQVAGQGRNNLARLNSDGTLDTGYNPNLNGAIRALVLQPDGNLLVGGAFTQVSGQGRNRVARIVATTGAPDSFNPNADNEVRALALQPDGAVLIGGAFTNLGGSGRNRIARVDSAGVLQPFNPNVNSDVRAIVVDGSGQVYLGGVFSTVVGTGSGTTYNRSRLTRLNAAGAVDTNYAIEVNGEVRSMQLLSTGQIAIMGTFTAVGTTQVTWLARLDSTGKDDASFVPNPDYEVRSLVEQPDGKLLVGGVFSNIGGGTQQWVGRLNTDGTKDASFLRQVDNRGRHTAMLSVNGNPAITYQDAGRGDLYYTRATDVNGASWTTNVVLDNNANVVGLAASMEITNIGGDIVVKDLVANNASIPSTNGVALIGMPAVAYFDDTAKTVKYVMSNDVAGTDWSSPVVIATQAAPHLSLRQVNGAPALAYVTQSGVLNYMYATHRGGLSNSTRTINGDPQTVSIPSLTYTPQWGLPIPLPGATGVQYPSLSLINGQPAVVAGNPAVAFISGGQLKYIQSVDATGAVADSNLGDGIPEGSWLIPAVPVAVNAGAGNVTLATTNGVAGISYRDSVAQNVKFIHLSDAAGYTRLAFSDNTVLNGGLQLNGMAIMAPDAGKNTTLNGSLSGTGGFRLAGGGSLTLNSSDNTFGSGVTLAGQTPVVIRSGHLLLGSSTALGAGANSNSVPRINLGDRAGNDLYDADLTIAVDYATTGASVLAGGGTFEPLQEQGTFVNVSTNLAGRVFAGSDANKLVFVKDESANPAFNGVYRVVFRGNQPANTMDLERANALDEIVEFVPHTQVQIPAGPEKGAVYFLASTVTALNTSPVRWAKYNVVDRASTGFSMTRLGGRFDKLHNGQFGNAGGPGAFVEISTTIDGRTYSIADVGTWILVKDEEENPERNGIYQIAYSPGTQADNTMNLVRVPSMDEAYELGYGTSVKVLNGSLANKAYFLASNVSQVNVSPVRWVEEQLDGDLSLKANVAGLTIQNHIDLLYRNGAGAMSLGGSSTLGNGTVSFTGSITLKNNSGLAEYQTLNLDSSTNDGFGVQVTGVISESAANDVLSVKKVGTGTVTLSAANTFKGGVTVDQGTLLVMNPVGSATGTGLVQVNAGAALGGTGRISGAVNLTGTGTDAAGQAKLRLGDPTISGGIETLTINGPLTVGPNAVVEFTLSGTASFTKLAATNGITLTETGRLLVSLAAGYTPNTGDSFKILDLTGPLNLPSGAVLGDYLKLPGAFTWNTSTFAMDGTITITGATLAVDIPGNGHPVPVAVNPGAGTTVQFTVNVTGSADFVYQWQRAVVVDQEVQWVNVGPAVRSALTTNTFTKNGITEADEGDYRVKVTNGETAYEAISNPALLTVNNPPTIDDQPDAVVVNPGANATFVVDVSGPAPYTFQWRRGTTNINAGGRFSVTNNAGRSTLVISTVEPADEGSNYNVVVSNAAGAVFSNLVALDVSDPVTFVSHPASISVGTGDPAFFRVNVSGTGPFQYQWELKLKDAAVFSDLPGETGPTLRLPTVAVPGQPETILAKSGDSVRVRVTNTVGPVTSNAALITVTNGVPSFLESPDSKTVLEGTTLVLRVKVGGTQQGRSVVWKKNNALVRTGPNVIAGVTSTVSIVETTEDGALVSTLTIQNISTGFGGQYTCDAKNAVTPKAQVSALTDGKITVVSNPNSIVPIQNGTKTASLSVVAVGPPKDKAFITYKWLKNGSDSIANDIDFAPTNLPKLTIKNVSTEDAATYTCVVVGSGNTEEERQVTGGTQELRVYTQPALLGTIDFPPAMVGSDFFYQVPVDADPSRTPDSYAAKGLPAGLKLDAKSGRITGRPTKAGMANVTITVKNKYNPPSVSAVIPLDVQAIPAGAVGVFAGWLPRHEINDEVGGRYDMTVAPTGAFTGKVTLGATAYAFKGTLLLEFDDQDQLLAPNATVTVVRAKTTPLNLTFVMNPGNDRLASASVSTVVQREVDGEMQFVTLTSPFNAWRNKWSKALPANPYLNELAVADLPVPKPAVSGYYTFALMPPDGSADAIPQGDSYATFTVNAEGKLSMVGKTADGQAITGAQFVGPSGEIVVYQVLYKTTPRGSLVGQITLNKVDDSKFRDNIINSSPSSAPTWSRPADVKSTTYAAGFSPITLTATGGAYEDPTRKQVHSADVGPYPLLLGLTNKPVVDGVDPNKDNAKIEFSLDALEGLGTVINPSLPYPSSGNPGDAIDITSVNKVLLPLDNPYNTTLTVAPKTGIITGKVTVRGLAGDKLVTTTVTYQGVIVKTGTVMRGMGYFLMPKQLGQKVPLISNQALLSPLP